MKRTVFISIFVFSLVLNLAVAATLGWHILQENRTKVSYAPPTPALSDNDLRLLRNAWVSSRPTAMVETRRKIIEKQLELLDQIAEDPGHPEVATRQLNELNALKAEIEKQAVARISRALAELPPARRQAFIAFLKSRSCMAPGMGMHRCRGMRGMGCCPIRRSVGE
jgi:hypothetical protein